MWLCSLQDAFVRALAHLWSHAQVHLLITSLDVVRSLRHPRIHVEVCICLVADSTHQYIVCFIARFFHLLVRTHQLVVVCLRDELHVGLVLVLEAHHVRLVHAQLPIR